MAIDIKSLKDKTDPLVFWGQDACVLATKWGVGTIPEGITTDPAGNLMALPTNWHSAGELDQKAGITITPDMKTTEVKGYGSKGPRRVAVTEETVTLGFTAQETRAMNLEMFWNVDFANQAADANGEVLAKKSYSSKLNFWSIIVIAQDQTEYGEVFPYWIFPKVSVTKTDALKLSTDEAIAYPVTLTAYEDEAFGGFIGIGHAGAGFQAVAPEGGFDIGT